MFDAASRYHALAARPLIHIGADGREIPYVPRRLLPSTAQHAAVSEVAVVPGDRLDLIAARVWGRPELFWRVCDTNDAMNPFALLDEIGPRVRIPAPHDPTVWSGDAAGASLAGQVRLQHAAGRQLAGGADWQALTSDSEVTR